jgi:hypothetical protein
MPDTPESVVIGKEELPSPQGAIIAVPGSVVDNAQGFPGDAVFREARGGMGMVMLNPDRRYAWLQNAFERSAGMLVEDIKGRSSIKQGEKITANFRSLFKGLGI